MKKNPIMGFFLFYLFWPPLPDLVDHMAFNTLYIVVYTFVSRKKMKIFCLFKLNGMEEKKPGQGPGKLGKN